MSNKLLLAACFGFMSALTPSLTRAQSATSAGGACGYTAGDYQYDALAPGPGHMNIGQLYWRAQYDGVAPGTTVKVLIYYNDELESFIGQSSASAIGPAGEVTGSVTMGAELGGSPTNKEALRANHGGIWAGDSSGQKRHKAGATYLGHTRDGNSTVSGRPGMYYFRVNAGQDQIGWWRCAVLDR